MNEEDVKLTILGSSYSTHMELPFAESGIRAGFPSPAQDYMGDAIDFNRDMILHPECTFYARCAGDSMIDIGIDDGDLLVIDKLLEPKNGDIVVAYIDGEFTLKRLKTEYDTTHHKKLFLISENQKYDPIEITEENNFRIWGVLIYTIKKFR